MACPWRDLHSQIKVCPVLLTCLCGDTPPHLCSGAGNLRRAEPSVISYSFGARHILDFTHVVPPSSTRQTTPTTPAARRYHSRRPSTPKRLACLRQTAGHLGHGRSALPFQTSESGLSGDSDVCNSRGTGAWFGGNAESRPQWSAAIQVHYPVRR